MEVLGVHTLVPGLTALPAAYKNTILEKNKGLLPPYLVVCGDRRRVEFVAMQLDNATLLRPKIVQAGGDGYRVEVAVGTYKGTPIAVIETQMGCSATEILMREIISEACSSLNFNCGDFTFRAPHHYLVRLGSAVGINSEAKKAAVNVFDAVIATHNVGLSGADLQALTGRLNFLDSRLPEQAARVMKQHGYSVQKDKSGQSWYTLPVSDDVRHALVRASKSLPVPADNKEIQVHELGNFSKDSLYAEANEKEFTDLREAFDVGTSEMELATISRVAAQAKKHNQPISVGQVSIVVGLIPGASFVHDKPREAASMKFGIHIVLEGLHLLSLQHRSPRGSKL